MELIKLAFYEVVYYPIAAWIWFAAVAFGTCRFMGFTGIFLTSIIVAITVGTLDVRWIFEDIKNHPENGRDADFVFVIGVCMRILLFNVVLIPISAIALRLAKRGEKADVVGL